MGDGQGGPDLVTAPLHAFDPEKTTAETSDGERPFARSSLEDLYRAWEQDAEAEMTRAALGEFLIRNVRLNRETTSAVRRTTALIDVHANRFENLFRKLVFRLNILIGLAAILALTGIASIATFGYFRLQP